MLIGFTGYATVGKDTLFTAVKEWIEEDYPGWNVFRLSIADMIRSELYDILYNTYGIDPFDVTPEEKKLIRPTLKAIGMLGRKRFGTGYWINRLIREKYTPNSKSISIITDIRYVEDSFDEPHVLHQYGGTLYSLWRYGVLPFDEDERWNADALKPMSIASIDLTDQYPYTKEWLREQFEDVVNKINEHSEQSLIRN